MVWSMIPSRIFCSGKSSGNSRLRFTTPEFPGACRIAAALPRTDRED
jgi:hypothetical protein